MVELDLAGMMAKVGDANMSAGGVFLLPGDHKLKIREAKNGKAEAAGFTFFLAEFEILHSTNPGHTPGQIVEWMVPFKEKKYEGTYLGNVKNFLWAAFNGMDPTVTPERINGQVWALAVSEQQPLRDRYVAGTSIDKAKVNSEGNYTRTTFSPWNPPAVAA